MNNLDYLEKIISQHYKVSLRDNNRKRDVVDAKRSFSYIAREIYGLGYQFIANHFGLNHSTIVFHVKSFKNLYSTDEVFREKFNGLSIEKIKITNLDAAIDYHQHQINVLKEKKRNIIFPKNIA